MEVLPLLLSQASVSSLICEYATRAMTLIAQLGPFSNQINQNLHHTPNPDAAMDEFCKIEAQDSEIHLDLGPAE